MINAVHDISRDKVNPNKAKQVNNKVLPTKLRGTRVKDEIVEPINPPLFSGNKDWSTFTKRLISEQLQIKNKDQPIILIPIKPE